MKEEDLQRLRWLLKENKVFEVRAPTKYGLILIMVNGSVVKLTVEALESGIEVEISE